MTGWIDSLRAEWMKTLPWFAGVWLTAGVAMAAPGAPPSGAWDGIVTVNGVEVPFRFELALQRGKASGAFFNGDERVRSTAGTFSDAALSLDFAHYQSRLSATWADGRLAGSYERPGSTYGFSAVPHTAAVRPATGVAPSIAGPWEMAVKSPKGESAWRLFVRQSGAQVSASILRVDGDTGLLEGSYQGGRFVLSHFSGARPLLLELTPSEDDLSIVENGKTHYTAVRSEVARSRNLPEPADPARWTTLRDPTEPLRFSGKTLGGDEVNESDPRFKGKVVVLDIMGSWCPNCHDEAPYLAALDRKYRKRGLVVVSLSFEDAEQLKNPSRLRAFIERYGVEHTVLLGGEPAELKQKLPQAVNCNTWPVTFFIGRDGLVRSIHAGFAGKATGEAHEDLKQELSALVERLLAEKAP
jgi:thiol-disulfide isomerase/thioredoxin